MKKILKFVPFLVIAVLVGVTIAYAGSLTPPGAVEDTMYSLEDIYNLASDTTTTEGSGEIPATPGSVSATGKTLTEVYEAVETALASAGGGGLPKTEQTGCWNAAGGSVSCAGTGQDGQYLAGLPESGAHFTDNGDSTITDNATGLMWKQCSEGQSGASCGTGSATSLTWANALLACEADTTASNTDWRLPNVNELSSIIDFGGSVPAINATYFPATGSNNYWSSTTYNQSGSFAYEVFFDDGGRDVYNKTTTIKVRCVR